MLLTLRCGFNSRLVSQSIIRKRAESCLQNGNVNIVTHRPLLCVPRDFNCSVKSDILRKYVIPLYKFMSRSSV